MTRSVSRAIGLALIRRPWAGRLALAWGLGRALKASRRVGGAAFLGGLGVGAGLMYLLASRADAARGTPPRRAPAAPQQPARARSAARPSRKKPATPR